MEYPAHRLKLPASRRIRKVRKVKYHLGMAFDTKKSANSYASHHRRKGARILVQKAPKWVKKHYPKARYINYENWE